MHNSLNNTELVALKQQIKAWALELGFQDMAVSEARISEHDIANVQSWLANKYHGDMQWMNDRLELRAEPQSLHPALRILSFRMNHMPADVDCENLLDHPSKAYIARYSLGRDYHKLVRKRLTSLGKRIEEAVGEHQFRAFVDSAPVLEKPLAQQAGLGWIGKHSLLINKQAGSWFMLGELFTNIALPVDTPAQSHCGSCSSCMDVCPTDAIVAPYKLDARKCISYLTIEYKGVIDEQYRKAIGNRIFGCDDCQIFCPWNKFSQHSDEGDFKPRHHFDDIELLELFSWGETVFLSKTEGSAIRRSGYQNFMRNIAIALGNAEFDEAIIHALNKKLADENSSELLKEHIDWAIVQQQAKRSALGI